MKTDVVVIGGGIAGLATGALVAKQGRSVVVLEKGNQPGGRAYTTEEKGFTLNYGPHAVYRPTSGLLATILQRIGRPALPFGTPRASRSFWADGERFGSISDKPHQVLFNNDIFPAATRLRFAKAMAKVRFGDFEKLGDMTFGAWVERETNDVILRRWLIALGTVNTYTRPAAELSAKFLLQHLQRNIFAKDYVGYLHGGWRRIYESFIAALERDGGRLVTGARVQRLEVDAERIVAAITDGERYEADAFVSTLPPADAPALADEGTALHGELAQWRSIADVRALCMDLGFSRRLRDDLSYIFDVERDLYFSLHSEVSPDLAPEGGQLLHAMAYLSPEESADDEARGRCKDELMGGLDRFFAGWREALVVERTLPNVVVASARQTPEGMRHRVPMRSSVTPNLYFANDARESALNLSEISLASAVEVADAIAATPALTRPAEAVASS